MSHYNNNSTNSWQNRSNNSSTTSSLFGTPHDLLSYSSNQQLANSQNNTSLTGANSPSLVGSVPTSAYNNPAASLLAQFAVNSVNFSNLAATIPAALVNANVLAANLGVTNSNSGGYQWHTSSQTPLQQQSSTQINSRNTDQRIVSISSNNNNSNTSSNTFKSSSTSSNISNKNSTSNSSSSPHDNVRPLMEIDTIRRQNNSNNSKVNSNSNNKGISSNSSSLNNTNKNTNNSSSNNSNTNNGHSNSRDRDRDRNRDRDRDRDRDRNNDRRSITNDQSNSTSSNSSSSLANKHNLTITTTNLNANLNAAASNLAAANPLAQALLTQLAAQTTTPSSNALVAALAVANAAVTASQQQQQKQQQQTKNSSPSRNKSSSTTRRSRSPSSNRTKSNNTNSSNSRNNPANATSSSSSSHNKSSSTSSSTNHTTSSHKQRSKSPISGSSTKRLSSSNIQTSSSSKPSSSSSTSSSRYSIKLPKYPLDLLTNNVTGLKSRYSQLYIPSDFTNVKNNWQNSLPLNRSLKFNSRCLFHVMRKEAHSIKENTAVFDPPDADHTWTVKVMLLAMPSMNELFKRSCSFAEDPRDRLEHPAKVIQFLVGNKGKHELMALGGAWSASLDGPDPATNSQTLINTAIRTVKALTGIDLTPCTQWFRFLDIQYNRNEDFKTIILPNSNTTTDLENNNITTNNKNSSSSTAACNTLNGNTESNETKRVEATLELDDTKDIETTVIFLPNVWTLMPNSIEYQKLVEEYKKYIDNPPKPIKTDHKTNEDLKQEDIKTEEVQQQNQQQQQEQDQQEIEMTEDVQQKETETKDDVANESNDDKIAGLQAEFNSIEDLTKSLKAEYEAAKQANNQDEMNDEDESKLEPTHYSKLDVKKMKVDELRTELMARGLDTRGLKQQLTVRLKEALDLEKEKEDQNQTKNDQTKIENQIVEEEASKLDENQVNDATNNIDLQSNGENNDILYTHVNENDIDQLDAKEPVQFQSETSETTQSNLGNTSKQTNEEKTNSEKEARLERQARLEREKLYKLPQIPHLIVHPSRTAKQGKFDCQLVSLSHLLNYRKEDNKESSFEVSLFAEYFNEMLIRDFGFIIYKHLLTIRTDKDKELFALAATASNANKRKLSLEPEDDVKRSKLSDDSKSNEEASSTNMVDDSLTSKAQSQTIQLSKPKPKTVHPELLLSFVFFDTNRTNHINDKDLEDLLLCIGLCLSRSKIKALVSRLSFKDGSINYRTLTDKTTKENENDLNVNFSLPSDDDIVSSICNYIKRFDTGSSSFNKDTGLIELNGSTIDVLNTIKSLEKTEHTVLKLDQKLKDANDEIERLKILNKTSDRAKTRLTDELNDYKRKLKEQIRNNKEMDDKYMRYRDCLQRTKSQLNKIFDDVNDVMKRGQPTSSARDSAKRKSEDVKSKQETENSTATTKSTDSDVQSTQNSSLNQQQQQQSQQTTNINGNQENISNAEDTTDANLNMSTLNEMSNDQTASQNLADLDQEQAKSNEFENNIDQIDDEETNGLSSNDL